MKDCYLNDDDHYYIIIIIIIIINWIDSVQDRVYCRALVKATLNCGFQSRGVSLLLLLSLSSFILTQFRIELSANPCEWNIEPRGSINH